MSRKRNEVIQGDCRLRYTERGEEPQSNWVLIVGGAVLTAISVRIWCKLKDVFDGKRIESAHDEFKANTNSGPTVQRRLTYSLECSSDFGLQNGKCCCHCLEGVSGGAEEFKQGSCSPVSKDSDNSLQLVTIPVAEANKDNVPTTWILTPDQSRLCHPSSSSGSPSASDSGSDIFSKREVVQKLRQQLSKRDDMIMDMQAQLSELKTSLNSKMLHASHLQSQLDAVNGLLFDSELEMQHLRKTIADYCSTGSRFPEKPAEWQPDLNGHANGVSDKEMHRSSLEKSSDSERVEMFRKEVSDLKEVIEGKEFLIQSYKEQKVELCSKISELQCSLSSQTML